MRRFRYLFIPLAVFLLDGCADQVTTPTPDLVASAKKPPRPPEPPEPPAADPVDPDLLFAEYGGRKVGLILSFMDTEGARTNVLDGGDPVEGYSARWAPSGVRFVFAREIPIRRAPSEYRIMIGSLNAGSGSWTVQDLEVLQSRAFAPDWSSSDWIVFTVDGDLWTVRTDGPGKTRLTESGEILEAIWSRDGTKILAHTHDGSAYGLRLYSVDCGPAGCVQTSDPASWALSDLGLGPVDDVAPLDWAHTEDQVLCALATSSGWDLGVLDLSDVENPSLTNLTNSPDSGESQAAWSPDDTQVVHNRWTFDGAPAQLVIRDVSTGTLTTLGEADLNFGVDWNPAPPGGN